MMNKIIIFNVGGALSSYIEIGGGRAIIDLGKSGDFSPVHNFLLPLFNKQNYEKNEQNLFKIDQLFLSHLDNDHISDYIEFKKYFYPRFLTCPNAHNEQDDALNVNKQLLGGHNEIRNVILKDMTKEGNRTPPLGISDEFKQNAKLFFILPKECENNENLKLHYANNISLSIFIWYKNCIVYFPGDIQKEGLEYLVDNNHEFKSFLKSFKINYFVAPHHGLSTSFPQIFFNTIKGNKTDLNIISEKIRSGNSVENRSEVDQRYYDSNYCTGQNTLKQNGIKTSLGHIVIDLDGGNVVQYKDISDALCEFID